MKLMPVCIVASVSAILLSSWQIVTVSQLQNEIQNMAIVQSNLTTKMIALNEEAQPQSFQAITSATEGNEYDTTEANEQYDERVLRLEKRIERLTQSPTSQSVSQAGSQQDLLEAELLVDRMIDYGYMDDVVWNEINEKVENMTKQQNKAFWEKTFAAIENGEFANYQNE